MHQHRVTVDTGGTFSDFVYLDDATGAVYARFNRLACDGRSPV
jgi:N-methylhydantoinase A/oxoprolinase/acetone carboxylase beta subunit